MRANAALPFAGVQPSGIPTFGGFDSNAAAAADQLALTQFNSNSQIGYGGLFGPDEAGLVGQRNPWASTDGQGGAMGASPPFGAPLDLNYGGRGTPTPGLPKPGAPGVIGSGPMTRHNSVGSMAHNQFDMMRHGNASDLRISCSPPLSNLLGIARPIVVNSGTQTDDLFNEMVSSCHYSPPFFGSHRVSSQTELLVPASRGRGPGLSLQLHLPGRPERRGQLPAGQGALAAQVGARLAPELQRADGRDRAA